MIIKSVAKLLLSAKSLIVQLVYVSNVTLDIKFSMDNVFWKNWQNQLIEGAKVSKMESVKSVQLDGILMKIKIVNQLMIIVVSGQKMENVQDAIWDILLKEALANFQKEVKFQILAHIALNGKICPAKNALRELILDLLDIVFQ